MAADLQPVDVVAQVVGVVDHPRGEPQDFPFKLADEVEIGGTGHGVPPAPTLARASPPAMAVRRLSSPARDRPESAAPVRASVPHRRG